MIYVHIGVPKSGSSAIQVYLNDSHFELNKNGVNYPWPHEYSQKFKTSGGNGREFIKVINNGMLFNEVSAIRETLNDSLKKFDKTIVSSEALSVKFSNPNEIKEFLPQKTQVKVVVYLRNQIEKVISDINQTIKTNYRENYTYIPEGWYRLNDYYALLERWEGAFGRENILVREYSKSKMINNDVVEDFCELLDIKFLGYNKKERINPSLGFEYLELMRMINKYSNKLNDKKIKLFYKDIIWDLSEEKKNKYKSKITPIPIDVLNSIALRLNDSNKLISSKWNVNFIDLNKTVSEYRYVHPSVEKDILINLLEKIYKLYS